MNEENIIVEEGSDVTNDVDTDISVPQNIESIEEETVAQLQSTIASLREKISELEHTRDTQEKMLGQISDFSALFPAVDIQSIPESVWDTVKSGTPLAAAYALYEKRIAAQSMQIEKINSLNSLKSAGAAGKNTASEFFTPDDVRKMSHEEVRANFSKIKKSMTKWNQNNF